MERTPIPEDLRQRVLSAIAVELERDRAEQRRNTPDNGGASVWATTGDSAADQVPGAGQVRGAAPADQAALAGGAAPADDAAPGSGAGHVDSAALANGVTLAYGTAADWMAPAGETAAAGETAPVDWTAPADEADPAPGASLADGTTFAYGLPLTDGDVAPDGPAITDEAPPAGHTASLERAAGAVPPELGSVPDDDQVGEAAVPKAGASWAGLSLPRRAPGENGAPPPPAHLRREYLPPAWLGRRLDADAYTEPIPKVSGIRPDEPVSRQIDRPEAAGPVTFQAPPSRPVPSEPIPPPTEPRDDAAPGTEANPAEPPWAAAPPAAGTPTAPPGALSPGAGSAMPVLAASAAPETVPTAPDANTAQALQAGATPSAQPAPPGPAAPPSAGMHAPMSPAQAPYSWPSGPDAARPGNGTATGRPAARPAAQAPLRPERPGRRWRIAGLILAVLALVVAGAIALLQSGHDTHGGRRTGSGPAGAAVRNRAAAWVAGQVSQTAMVACDPVMCQALRAQGVPAPSLYTLGPQTTSPLHSQVIVATAVVRAQFGSLLGSVYAPAVLASFGAGPDRIDVRQTAQHGAGAYRAMVRADLANRRMSGAELLRSGRIAATFAARRQLVAGKVDPRLLITIAQMAATHPMYIVDFGRTAPGAGPDVPLRQADLAEDAHARYHPGRVASPRYVRSMVTFLHAQHGEFRPAYVGTVRLPGGAVVLRIEFTAPSPLGLIGPRT